MSENSLNLNGKFRTSKSKLLLIRKQHKSNAETENLASLNFEALEGLCAFFEQNAKELAGEGFDPPTPGL